MLQTVASAVWRIRVCSAQPEQNLRFRLQGSVSNAERPRSLTFESGRANVPNVPTVYLNVATVYLNVPREVLCKLCFFFGVAAIRLLV